MQYIKWIQEYRNGQRFSSQWKLLASHCALTFDLLQLSWLSLKRKLTLVLSSAGRRQRNAGNKKTNRTQADRFWCWRSGVMGMGIPYSDTVTNTGRGFTRLSLFGGIHRRFFTNVSLNFKGLPMNFCWDSAKALKHPFSDLWLINLLKNIPFFDDHDHDDGCQYWLMQVFVITDF